MRAAALRAIESTGVVRGMPLDRSIEMVGFGVKEPDSRWFVVGYYYSSSPLILL